ncbi:hypothetical protein BDR03DRAFT_1018337 [Suillus americanus]|nr:hypothetical protein BDR03DRAFT_1018337 [Suillus americanus]
MPRAPRKAKSRGDGDTAKEPAEASHLHLDQRPIQAQAPQHDIGKETQRLDTLVAKCKVGVAWVNLLDIGKQMMFGEYNDRMENDAETNKLIASFKGSGIVSMKDTSAIPIILEIDRIRPGLTLAKDFIEVDEVPELELIDSKKIIVASGQHRLSALRRYKKSLQDELSALNKRWTKIANHKKPTKDDIEAHQELRTDIGGLKGLLESIGQWGIIVYDKKKLLADGDQLACHLSRNNTLHEYKETEEEVLVTILRKVKRIYEQSPAKTRRSLALVALEEIRAVHDKNARLQKVLHNDSVCLLLATRLLRLGPHFRQRVEFSVTWLAKSINICMGVFVAWVNARVVILAKLGSDEPFPDYKTVSNLLDQMDAGNEEATEKVKTLRASINDSALFRDSDLSIWGDVAQALDKHAKTAFAEVAECIGEMTPSYITRLHTYQQNVVDTLQQTWLLKGRAKPGDADHLKHLDQVVARVALFLTPQPGSPYAPEPLLGGFMMDYAWRTFSRVEKGIAETCRWFEALLDSWHILHPKTHTMDDWSTVMLSNIRKDPRFNSAGNAGDAIVNIIWLFRDSLMIRLTNKIAQGNVVTKARAADKKALDKAFEELLDTEQVACNALLALVNKKRRTQDASRDLSYEPRSIAGMMVLHTTAWDWLKSGIKNASRDIEPCLRAITIERVYMLQYRPTLLKDKWIGALRRMFEIALMTQVKKKMIMQGKELVKVQEWVWWDDLALAASQADPDIVVAGIKDKSLLKQQQVQESLALESTDRDAINKLVAIVSNMACAKASTSPIALMSSDVLSHLHDLVDGLQVNSARLRLRTLNDDPVMEFNVSEDVDDLQITLPEGHIDEYTTGYVTNKDAESEPVVTQSGSHREVDTQPSPPEKDTPASAKRSSAPAASTSTRNASDTREPGKKPKPRPVPRKQRQPSPAPVLELSDSSSGEDGEAVPDRHSHSKTTTTDSAGNVTDDGSHKLQDNGVVEDSTRQCAVDVPVTDTSAPTSVSQTVDTLDAGVSLPADDTVPSASTHTGVHDTPAVATVALEGTDKANVDALSATPPSPSSLLSDFGPNDVSWFVKENAKEVETTGQEERGGDGMVPDSTADISQALVPTQPLTQPAMPPTQVPAEPIKRARAATGSSSSSSGRASKQKKKARIMQTAQDDDESA